MHILKAALAVAILLLGITPLAGQEVPLRLADGVESHEGIDRIYADFSKSYRTLDYGLLAGLYTQDAAYLSPNKEIVTGRSRVEESFKGFFGRMKSSGRSMTISFHIVKREVTDGLGFDVGTFEIQYSEKGKATNKGTGKFVVVTKRGKDGQWRFAVDGYSDLPPK